METKSKEQKNSRPHLVVLTGAGISAESGLKTFRDGDGLWMGYDIEDVATPRAWRKNPKLVLDFYNHRRAEVLKAKPNAAHAGLVDLEEYFDVSIITQNIDDLHERAGSKNVLHLHGEIFKMCSENNKSITYPIMGDINIGDFSPDDGKQLRPFIVWFEEPVPMMEEAIAVVEAADIFVVIGTSLQVYPAAGLVRYTPAHTRKYILDKHIPLMGNMGDVYAIEEKATTGIVKLKEILSQIL